MPYTLYEYVDRAGALTFSVWRNGLDSQQRARLDSKANMLRTAGPHVSSGLLAGTSLGHIRKLKVQGNVKLRPRLCEGPVAYGSEFTMLVGATEINFKTVPSNADQLAADRRIEVRADPEARRQHYAK